MRTNHDRVARVHLPAPHPKCSTDTHSVAAPANRQPHTCTMSGLHKLLAHCIPRRGKKRNEREKEQRRGRNKNRRAQNTLRLVVGELSTHVPPTKLVVCTVVTLPLLFPPKSLPLIHPWALLPWSLEGGRLGGVERKRVRRSM